MKAPNAAASAALILDKQDGLAALASLELAFSLLREPG